MNSGLKNVLPAIFLLGISPAAALAASAETIDSSLPAIPTGLLLSKGAFYGGAITGVNSYGTIYQLTPPSKVRTNWSVKIIYAFSDFQGDGAYPDAPVMADKAGNLYGSTSSGGSASANGDGTLYRLTPPTASTDAWSKQTIYQFQTPVQPQVKLAMDASGHLYLASGDNILQFTPPASGVGFYTMTVLPIVSGFQADNSGVIVDRFGNVYGVARTIATSPQAYDVVYQLTPPAAAGDQWASRILMSFDSHTHVGQLGLSPSGHMFGTTSPVSAGCGAANCTVFELVQHGKSSWTAQVIHNFAGDPLGSPPSDVSAGMFVPSDYELSFAPGGQVYGAITPSQTQSTANSTIYHLMPPANGQTAWTETALYTFQGTPNGFSAGTRMYIAGNGTVYGTAYGGGAAKGPPQSIAFKIAGP